MARMANLLTAVALVVISRSGSAQHASPVAVAPRFAHAAAVHDPAQGVSRPRRYVWLDFSGGILGALVGALVARATCDDEARDCGPVIIGGGVLGAAAGAIAARRIGAGG